MKKVIGFICHVGRCQQVTVPMKNSAKAKKKKLPSISLLKRKLDAVFSQYIRQRDEENGCISCEKHIPWKEAHAGHFISRRYSPTRYDEHNVNLQCTACNTFLHGNIDAYFIALEKKYGRAMVDGLIRLKHGVFKFDREWLQLRIDHYKQINSL